MEKAYDLPVQVVTAAGRVDESRARREGDLERHRVDGEVPAQQVLGDRRGTDPGQRARPLVLLGARRRDVEVLAVPKGDHGCPEPGVQLHLRNERARQPSRECVAAGLHDEVDVHDRPAQ